MAHPAWQFVLFFSLSLRTGQIFSQSISTIGIQLSSIFKVSELLILSWGDRACQYELSENKDLTLSVFLLSTAISDSFCTVFISLACIADARPLDD